MAIIQGHAKEELCVYLTVEETRVDKKLYYKKEQCIIFQLNKPSAFEVGPTFEDDCLAY